MQFARRAEQETGVPSLHEMFRRRNQLKTEIDDLQQQLDNPASRPQFQNSSDQGRWRHRTITILREKRTELHTVREALRALHGRPPQKKVELSPQERRRNKRKERLQRMWSELNDNGT